MPDICVQVAASAWQDDSEDPQSMARRTVGALDKHLGFPLKDKEITVRFGDDAEVRALNARFRGKDAATNVLAFPPSHKPDNLAALGDIMLARETVCREADEQGKTVADHTCHLILHALLHLLGYDHGADDEAEEMEAVERDVLAQLGIADPYAELPALEGNHGA